MIHIEYNTIRTIVFMQICECVLFCSVDGLLGKHCRMCFVCTIMQLNLLLLLLLPNIY